MLLPRLRLAPGLLLLCLAARAALGGPAPLNLPGSALWFNGPNDRDPTFLGSMLVPGIVGGAADQITVSAWVKIDRHKTHNLVAISYSRAAGWALFIDGAAKACFGLFQKSPSRRSPPGPCSRARTGTTSRAFSTAGPSRSTWTPRQGR